MIKAEHLVKRFNKLTAVNNVSLHVKRGQIFGLLGPNAAGKTTVIRMLCGILGHDEGEVRLNQKEIMDAKSDFGYVAQHFGQYEDLTVWENLQFYARMYGVDDEHILGTLLERYDLTRFREQRAGTLSGGYKRRLALACALAHDPEILFLDEPTAGIDPLTRKLLWDDFYRLSTEGKTLFVTTHYMEEAQRCHQLAFLSAGVKVAEGTPETIREALDHARVYSTDIPYLPELRDILLSTKGMILVNQFGNELRLVVAPGVEKSELETVIQSVIARPALLQESEPNLEDVFIALTQEQPEGR